MIDGHHMIDTGTGDIPVVRSQRTANDRWAGHAPCVRRGVVAIPEDAALVLIGFQRAFEHDPLKRPSGRLSGRNNPGAERAAARLLTAWRSTPRPVAHVRHVSTSATSPLSADASGAQFGALVQPDPGESVYRKGRGSAFVDTTLAKDLIARRVRTIVVAGLTTDLAISPTVRSAADLGLTTLVVSDATATFDREATDGTRFPAELMHQTALASLNADVAIVLSSELVLEGLARAAV